MLTCGIKDFYQGDTKTYRFVFQTKNADGTKTPIDVSGDTLYFTAKSSPSDTDTNAVIKVAEVQPSNTDTANGIGTITLSSTDTNANPQELYFDFRWEQSGTPPIVKTLRNGTFNLLQAITQTIT